MFWCPNVHHLPLIPAQLGNGINFWSFRCPSTTGHNHRWLVVGGFWRIIPLSKWLIAISWPCRPLGKGITPVRGLINHGYYSNLFAWVGSGYLKNLAQNPSYLQQGFLEWFQMISVVWSNSTQKRAMMYSPGETIFLEGHLRKFHSICNQ